MGFKFEIGYNFKSDTRDCIILDRFYNSGGYKTYKILCNKCKGTYECLESNLFRLSCSICSNKKVIKGINSFGDLKPDLIKYFKNPEDAYKYSVKSEVKVGVICPNCNTEHFRELRVCDISNRNGFTCEICGSKESIPNKIGRYIFGKFLNDNFIPEYNPKDWNNLRKRRYDFYFELNNVKYVVELDGGFHKSSKFEGYEKVIKNDLEKTIIAKENGCEMIRIDCSKSKILQVYESIKNSKLGELFNFDIIDVKDMLNVITSSKIKEVCEYKKNNYNLSTKEIAKIFKLSSSTIWEYLKIGNIAFDWFTYDNKKLLSNKSISSAGYGI